MERKYDVKKESLEIVKNLDEGVGFRDRVLFQRIQASRYHSYAPYYYKRDTG